VDHITTEGAIAPVKQASWRKPPGRRGQLPEGDQRLVGIDAAAKMLGVSTTYAYRLIRGGELPVVDLGKRTLVKVTEIDALIERKTRRAPAAATVAA
jgi:excisionase family DNA binding protein